MALPATPLQPKSAPKTSYEAQKEFSKKLKKAEKAVQDTESVISKIEADIAAMNALLESPDNASNPDFIVQYQKKQRDLEQKMYEWEILSEEVEKLKQ